MDLLFFYSGLTLNQHGVASPCPDLKLIHYTLGCGKGRDGKGGV